MRRGRMKASLVGATALLAASLLASSAWADTVSFNLTTGNSAISGFPGPYATVTVNRTDSTHATITFDSLTGSGGSCPAGGCTYLFGDGGSVAVNVNATSWTLGTITGSNSGTGFTPGPWSDAGAGNEDGFGSFNQTIDSFDGYTHSSTQISFTLTDTSGTWATAASVLTGNQEGLDAAAHIFVCSGTGAACNASTEVALATGFASTPGPILGGGLPGLVMACGGLVALARRRRQKVA
jgi:hypothetical protein